MKFSIVVPVYNADRYVRSCLDSILSQTYSEWECICIDDGSVDSSLQILDRYGSRDKRFHVIHQDNAGVSEARNAALRVVTGDWVTFVDADDILNERWLERAANSILNEDPDLLRLDYICGATSIEQMNSVTLNEKYCVFKGSDARRCLWKVLPQKGFLWLCFVKKEIAKKRLFKSNINYREDSIWLLELIPDIDTFLQCDFKGYGYRITQGSLVRRKRRASTTKAYLEAMLKIWSEQKELVQREGYLDDVRFMIRVAAESAIVEWAIKSQKPDDMSPKMIRLVYFDLLSSGALAPSYGGLFRYRLGLTLFRCTGSLFVICFVGRLFAASRRLIDLVKRVVKKAI